MKTLTLTLLLSVSLFANDVPFEKEEMLSYSDLAVNESLSLYAGKVGMDFFERSDAYSVGILLQEDKGSDIQFGLGYMQPCEKLNNLFNKETQNLYSQNEDGVLFFMNYIY